MTEWLEYTAVALGVLYIALATRRVVWCWPVGIASSAIGMVLFIEVKIYAEAFLFAYYVVMGAYGWYQWKGSSKRAGEVKVDSWSLGHHLTIAVLGYAAVAAMYQLLHRYTDAAMPLLDSYTTAFSFVATWLTARRVLENWIYWVVVNLCSIYLYVERGLPAFAALAALYSVLSVYGYVQWRQHIAAPHHSPAWR